MKNKIEKLIMEILRPNKRLGGYSIKTELEEKGCKVNYSIFSRNIEKMREKGLIGVYPAGRSSSNKISGFLYKIKEK